MKSTRVFWIAICAVLVICAVAAGFLALPRQAAEAKSQNMVGAWDATIVIPQGNTSALITMTSDGIILGDEVADAYETTAHGNWIKTGPSQASYTFLAIIGGPDLIETGKLKVVGSFTYDPQTDSISGPFKITQVDPQGNLVFEGEGIITGTRIQVETLE